MAFQGDRPAFPERNHTMKPMTRRLTTGLLAAVALNLAAHDVLASPPSAVASGANTHEDASPAGWTARVEPRDQGTALLITDEGSGTRYRLADFEGIGVVDAHWIGPQLLMVDFQAHQRMLEVRRLEADAAPTFHLVTSRFHVQGAARVDFYSPPLLALHDARAATADEPTR